MTLTGLIIQIINTICYFFLSWRIRKLEDESDQLRAQLEQMKIDLETAKGEARAALLVIHELNSKK